MKGLKNAFQNKQHSSADGKIRLTFTGFFFFFKRHNNSSSFSYIWNRIQTNNTNIEIYFYGILLWSFSYKRSWEFEKSG